MASQLAGLPITILGGDAREKTLMRKLVVQGAMVRAVGFNEVTPGVVLMDDGIAAVQDAVAVIVPLTGTDANGKIRTVENGQTILLDEKLISCLKPKTLLLIGSAKPYLRQLADRYGIRVIETAELDEIAIPNAVPTVEGAIKIAIEESPITLHGSRCLVLGYGRVGTAMAKVLTGLGARALVLSREPVELAKAEAMGLETAPLADLAIHVKEANFIFNTIPFSVLTERILWEASPDVLIIDLATAPGGTDFAAAQQLGIKALLCPGLPGKFAPKTAGEILARVIPAILARELSGVVAPD